MPQKRNNPPIGRMTWGRAIPVLIVCAVFDLVRMFFEFFWFFGPALAGLACTIAGSNTTLGSVVGTTATAAACSAAAGAVGFFGAVPIQAFGIIMAMATGLAGWGTIVLILTITNPGIWKSGAWAWGWSLLSLGVSEVPFLGTLPMLTITHARLYAGQIKHDKAALKKYQEERAQVSNIERQIRQRNQQIQQTQLMQAEANQSATAEVY